MGVPTLPDFMAPTSLAADDVRTADLAILAEVGGLAPSSDPPTVLGNLGRSNFVASPGFRNIQKQESRSIFQVMVRGDRWLAPFPLKAELQAVTVINQEADYITGTIRLKRNSESLLDIALPDSGVLTAETHRADHLGVKVGRNETIEIMVTDPDDAAWGVKVGAGAGAPTLANIFLIFEFAAEQIE